MYILLYFLEFFSIFLMWLYDFIWRIRSWKCIPDTIHAIQNSDTQDYEFMVEDILNQMFNCFFLYCLTSTLSLSVECREAVVAPVRAPTSLRGCTWTTMPRHLWPLRSSRPWSNQCRKLGGTQALPTRKVQGQGRWSTRPERMWPEW